MKRQIIVIPIVAVAVVVFIGVGAVNYTKAAGATAGSSFIKKLGFHKGDLGHAVAGTVKAINGTTLTVEGRDNVTYTVDASAAKLLKAPEKPADADGRPIPASIAISDIQVGDTIMVRGVLSGTSIEATGIFEGKIPSNVIEKLKERRKDKRGIVGTIEEVSGDTLTVDARNGTSYTVLADNAIVMKGDGDGKPDVIEVSDLHKGDTVMVRGKIDGTTITAKSIFDGMGKNRMAGIVEKAQ